MLSSADDAALQQGDGCAPLGRGLRNCPLKAYNSCRRPACERRFRTDAQNEARPCYAPTEPVPVFLLSGSCGFFARAGEQELTQRGYSGGKRAGLRASGGLRT